MHDLKHLYFEELRDLHSAESQLIKALPKVAKAANSPELKSAIESHLEQTKGHRDRLEEIFKAHGEKATGKHCKGMEGLIAETDEMIKEAKDEGADPNVLDAGLIAGAQRVEHYEIAGYGSVRTFASKLGLQDDKVILQQILDEEGAADLHLTQLAMGEHGEKGINEQAMANGKTAKSEKSMAKSTANGKSSERVPARG